jgi:hypothetical protein
MLRRQPQIIVVGRDRDTQDFAAVFTLLKSMEKIAA